MTDPIGGGCDKHRVAWSVTDAGDNFCHLCKIEELEERIIELRDEISILRNGT